MVLYLRHSDQVIRVRTSSTCECDGQFTQAKGLRSRGPELAHRTVWHFTTASLPLRSAGPNCPRAFDSSRSQKGLYRKDIHFVDPKSPPTSSAGRRHDQPMGGRCAAALLEPASRSWLSARASAESVAKTNMCMIVSHRKRCRRFITGWCALSPRANTLPR